MAKTFASQKFTALLATGIVEAVVDYLGMYAGNLIAGNIVGESALSAIMLTTPLYSFMVFIGLLLGAGMSAMIAYEVGRGDREAASRYFSQGLLVVTGAGLVLSGAFAALYLLVPNLFGVPEATNTLVREYFFYLCARPPVLLLVIYVAIVVVNEGGEKLYATAAVLTIAAQIPLTVALCFYMGIGGISLGCLIGQAVLTGTVATFFFTKRNMLRFRWFFSPRSVFLALRYSVVDASTYLSLGVMQLALNTFLLRRFGEGAIVIFTVIISVQAMLVMLFNAFRVALMSLISVYRGENCQRGIMKTMRAADGTALVEGLGITLLLLVFAGSIPGFFGITTPELAASAATALRIYAAAALPVAFAMLYTFYYLYMEKTGLAVCVSMQHLLLCPALLGPLFGLLAGLNGVWAAFVLGAFFAILSGTVLARRLYPLKKFPLLLDAERLDQELSYDVLKTRKGVMELVDAVERDLKARGVEQKKIFKIMLMIEETGMLGLETREEKDRIVECNIFLEDEITVILRDTGRSLFVMDEDNRVSSLNSYVYSRLLAHQQEKRYILTGGKNRIIYKF